MDMILASPLPSPHVPSGGGGGEALPTAFPAGDVSLHLHRDEAQRDLVTKLSRTGSKNAPPQLLFAPRSTNKRTKMKLLKSIKQIT